MHSPIKTRTAVAVLAAAALGVAGLVAATSSNAATDLAFADGVTTATVSHAAQTNSALSYGTNVQGATTGGGSLCVEKISGPGVLIVRHAATATPGPQALCFTSTDHFVFLAGTTVGDYKVRVFQDANGNGAYDQAQNEPVAPLFTLTVADLVPTVVLTSPEDAGSTVTINGYVTYAPAPTLTDVRGDGATAPLGKAIAAASGLTTGWAGCGGVVALTGPFNTKPTFDGTQHFPFTEGNWGLAPTHNGGTVNVKAWSPDVSGAATTTWLHSADASKVIITKLGAEASPNGVAFKLGTRANRNDVPLFAEFYAPGPVLLQCASYVVTTSPGTYDVDGDVAKTTLHGHANDPGTVAIQRIVFTKAGPAKITVTSGAASDNITPVGAPATDAYKVDAPAITGPTSSHVTVVGTVADGFGNPVGGAPVALGGVSGGTGGFTTTGPTTGADGKWSSIFETASSPAEGSYTATIPGGTVAAGNWLGITGITVPATVNQVTSTVSVTAVPAAHQVTISADNAPAGGTIHLAGEAPTGPVKITVSPAGAPTTTFTATANAANQWTATWPATRTTTFTASVGSDETAPVTVTVTTRVSNVIVNVLGGGKVTIKAAGAPGGGRWWFTRNGKLIVVSSSATVTVKLPKGKATIGVQLTAPGCVTGARVNKSVTVK